VTKRKHQRRASSVLSSQSAIPKTLETLPPRQRRFVEEYLIDLNATEASIRAGYSRRNANKIGPELLGKTRSVIQPLLEQTSGITKERWLQEIRRLGFYDPRKLFDSHGNPKEICELDDDCAPAIAGFEFVEEFIGKKDETRTAVGYTKKFKLADKLRALELFGKAAGHYTEKREVTGTLTLEQLLTEVENAR
jgi:phage terminase small subunit